MVGVVLCLFHFSAAYDSWSIIKKVFVCIFYVDRYLDAIDTCQVEYTVGCTTYQRSCLARQENFDMTGIIIMAAQCNVTCKSSHLDSRSSYAYDLLRYCDNTGIYMYVYGIMTTCWISSYTSV